MFLLQSGSWSRILARMCGVYVPLHRHQSGLAPLVTIGSIDTDFEPEGSARIKLRFKDGETLTLQAAQITRITEGWNLTSYPVQVVHG